MEKKFEMSEDGLIVTVESGDKLWLPQKDAPDGKVFIGKYTQTTRQVIDKDKASLLKDFIAAEKAKGDEQANAIDTKLKELIDVNDQELDADLVKAVKDQIGKGTKVFKQKMLALNTHIEKVAQKQQLVNQKKYMVIELTRLNKELSDISKALE